MPLEALAYDITQIGMHYLLIHWDVPKTDAETWTVGVEGLVDRSLSLSMDDLRARPAVTMAVTMECAGNGRARLSPRPISQPWIQEAVGTAEWTGTPLAPILSESGLRPDAVEILFTGADHGIQGEVEQDYQRSLSIEEAMRRGGAPRVRHQRTAPSSPARIPRPPDRPRLVRHDEREVAANDRSGPRTVRGIPRWTPTGSATMPTIPASP